MKVESIHIGKRILPKTMITELKLKPVLKDPLIIKDSNGKYISIFKYGVVVFWGQKKAERDKFLKTIKPFIKDSVRSGLMEEMSVKKEVSIEKAAVISLVLSRSVALEYYEKEVEEALTEFNPVMRSFEEKGKPNKSTRALLKLAGFAMNVRHLSMASMALLDRPDVAWEDPEVDKFYDELSDEYEIDDRYHVLNEKTEVLFRNSEFILTFVDSKRTIWLEATIVILIVIEILIFVYEVWLM